METVLSGNIFTQLSQVNLQKLGSSSSFCKCLDLGRMSCELGSYGRRVFVTRSLGVGLGFLRGSHFLRKRRIVRSIFKILQGVEFELS